MSSILSQILISALISKIDVHKIDTLIAQKRLEIFNFSFCYIFASYSMLLESYAAIIVFLQTSNRW